jgi:hypothetical protein
LDTAITLLPRLEKPVDALQFDYPLSRFLCQVTPDGTDCGDSIWQQTYCSKWMVLTVNGYHVTLSVIQQAIGGRESTVPYLQQYNWKPMGQRRESGHHQEPANPARPVLA